MNHYEYTANRFVRLSKLLKLNKISDHGLIA